MFKFLLGLLVGFIVSSVGLVNAARLIDDQLNNLIFEIKKHESEGSSSTDKT